MAQEDDTRVINSDYDSRFHMDHLVKSWIISTTLSGQVLRDLRSDTAQQKCGQYQQPNSSKAR